jgi:hypothetical protein
VRLMTARLATRSGVSDHHATAVRPSGNSPCAGGGSRELVGPITPERVE